MAKKEKDISKVIEEVIKHLPGQHDQDAHAGSGQSRGSSIDDRFESLNKELMVLGRYEFLGNLARLKRSIRERDKKTFDSSWNSLPDVLRQKILGILNDQDLSFLE